MEYIDFFKQLFVVAFGVFAALVLSFYIIWPKIENYLLKINTRNQSHTLHKENLQLRFGAYERLLLLVHRISPQEVLVRNYNDQLSIDQYKNVLIADIENEFQHNFTQQLYVSDAAWTTIKVLKTNTITLIKNTSKVMGDNVNLDHYVSSLLKHVSELELNPYDAAQLFLKKELSA